MSNAKFILQRNGKEYLAVFKIKGFNCHPLYEDGHQNVLDGFDIAIAEANLVPDSSKQVNLEEIDEQC